MSKTILLQTTLTLALILAAPAPADAGPTWTTADRARVEKALSAYETIPGRGEILMVHPAAHEILLDIVRFPASRKALASSRALAVLRHFPSRATSAALLQVIRRTDALARATRPRTARGQIPMSLAMVDLRQALTSYAAVKGPASLALLRPYLAFPNPDVRATAAIALRASKHPKARAALLAHQRVERSAMVRHEIKRQLKLLKRAKR